MEQGHEVAIRLLKARIMGTKLKASGRLTLEATPKVVARAEVKRLDVAPWLTLLKTWLPSLKSLAGSGEIAGHINVSGTLAKLNPSGNLKIVQPVMLTEHTQPFLAVPSGQIDFLTHQLQSKNLKLIAGTSQPITVTMNHRHPNQRLKIKGQRVDLAAWSHLVNRMVILLPKQAAKMMALQAYLPRAGYWSGDVTFLKPDSQQPLAALSWLGHMSWDRVEIRPPQTQKPIRISSQMDFLPQQQLKLSQTTVTVADQTLKISGVISPFQQQWQQLRLAANQIDIAPLFQWFRQWAPQTLSTVKTASGQISLDVTGTGSLRQPGLTGWAKLENGQLIILREKNTFPIEAISAQLHFLPSGYELTQGQAKILGAPLQVTAQADHTLKAVRGTVQAKNVAIPPLLAAVETVSQKTILENIPPIQSGALNLNLAFDTTKPQYGLTGQISVAQLSTPLRELGAQALALKDLQYDFATGKIHSSPGAIDLLGVRLSVDGVIRPTQGQYDVRIDSAQIPVATLRDRVNASVMSWDYPFRKFITPVVILNSWPIYPTEKTGGDSLL